MNITIQEIVALTAVGQRLENEDCLFPDEEKISSEDRLFVVCDGVGGHRAGKNASQLVCRHFSDYIVRLGDTFQTKAVLTGALRHTEQLLDEHVRAYPEDQGLATTLAYLHLSAFGALVAWVGDSRVLQIREGRIIRQTKDHSLVNALLDLGEITAAEATTHSKKDILMQVVTGSTMPAKIDIMYIDDIMPGDYFMLCTDGVVEGVGNKLSALFAESFSIAQIRYDIDALCRRNTSDNYSMILLRIGQSTDSELTDDVWYGPELAAASPETAPRSARVDGPELRHAGPWRRPALFLFAMILCFGFWWYLLPPGVEIALVAGNGVMIQDEDHKVLIDAFPLTDKVRDNQALEPVRQAMLLGRKPFRNVDLFLVSHPPNVETDSIAAFLTEYLARNPAIRVHPTILRDQLAGGDALFQTLTWDSTELNGEMENFVQYLSARTEKVTETQMFSSVFRLNLHGKTILYAGDPRVDVTYLGAVPTAIDYLVVNEWSLRTGVARRALLSKFEERSIIVLPSSRPMNNQQREEIRNFLPHARYLDRQGKWLNLK